MKVGRFCLQAPPRLAAGIGGSNLGQRIRRILTDAPRPVVVQARVVVAVLIAALAASATGAGVMTAAAQDGGQRPDAPDIQQPVVVSRVAPSYTVAAMRAGIEGTVMLEAVVRETGTIDDIRIVRSLDTEHGLDEQAVAALRQWEFEPGRRDGRPVPVTVTVVMDFALRRSRP